MNTIYESILTGSAGKVLSRSRRLVWRVEVVVVIRTDRGRGSVKITIMNSGPSLTSGVVIQPFIEVNLP